MSEQESFEGFARVLVEAGEVERLVYEQMGAALADPGITEGERERALFVHGQLERMFDGRRELAEQEEEDEA